MSSLVKQAGRGGVGPSLKDSKVRHTHSRAHSGGKSREAWQHNGMP